MAMAMVSGQFPRLYDTAILRTFKLTEKLPRTSVHSSAGWSQNSIPGPLRPD